MKYAVRCRTHGLVELTEEQYSAQMDDADALWCCPTCGAEAEWDDETYESNLPSYDEIHDYDDPAF